LVAELCQFVAKFTTHHCQKAKEILDNVGHVLTT